MLLNYDKGRKRDSFTMDRKASHDLIAAEILIQANLLILDIACFHCQQAVEKYLKSFLVYHNRDFIFTHNLEYLAQKCSEIDTDFSDLDMQNLTLYAVRARYPHDHVTPELLETTAYYQIASDIKGLVLSKLFL